MSVRPEDCAKHKESVRPKGRSPTTTRSESGSDQGLNPTQGRSPTESDFARHRPCWKNRQSVRLRLRPNFQKSQ
eukprot:gene15082-biopygen3646